jgi:hypothetical protein
MPTFAIVALIGRKINSLADIQALELRTYVAAVAVALVVLAIAAVISNGIAYEGGANPKDPRKRRMVYWLLAATAFAAFFVYHVFMVAPLVAVRWQGRFMSTTVYSAIAVVATYVLTGFVLSRVFANGKIGTWFGRGGRARG